VTSTTKLVVIVAFLGLIAIGLLVWNFAMNFQARPS
jgi:hypothetical protein